MNCGITFFTFPIHFLCPNKSKSLNGKKRPDDGKSEAFGPLSCEDDRGGVVDWNREKKEFAVSPIIHLSETL